MTPEIWIALAAANFLSAVAPGQNVALVGAATARGGMPGGLAATGGILVAELAWSVLALFCAIGAKELDPAFAVALQGVSGAFLLVYGIVALRRASAEAGARADAPDGHGRTAVRGFWIGFANPVSLMFFLSLFPLFVPAGVALADPALVAFCASAVILSTAAALAPYLALSGLLARRGLGHMLERLSGAALTLLGGAVLLRVAM